MSREEFDDNCPDCKPTLIDVRTGAPMSKDSPEMRAIEEIWKTLTRDEKLAFHRFTCLNDYHEKNLAVIRRIVARIQAAGDRTKC